MSLDEFYYESLGYFMFTLIMAGAILVVVATVLLTYAGIVRSMAPWRMLQRFALILGAVVLLGLPADFLWNEVFPGRWYLDKDHVFGFSPVLPFRLDTMCGDHFIGYGSYLTIEAAWLVFAVAVWASAIRLVRKNFVIKASNQGAPATANSESRSLTVGR